MKKFALAIAAMLVITSIASAGGIVRARAIGYDAGCGAVVQQFAAPVYAPPVQQFQSFQSYQSYGAGFAQQQFAPVYVQQAQFAPAYGYSGASFSTRSFGVRSFGVRSFGVRRGVAVQTSRLRLRIR